MKDLFSLGLVVEKNRLRILDQQRLPGEELWVEVKAPAEMVAIIQGLKIRGAPLIGVGAALALAHYAEQGATAAELAQAAAALKAARPTAVNLQAAIDRVWEQSYREGVLDRSRLIAAADELFSEDQRLCEQMAEYGAALIAPGDGILTHCNTGGLATVGCGTALGVLRRAHEAGKDIQVYADETRPLLQGARLTAWECQKLGIPCTVLCDGAAAALLRSGRVQKVFLGADRVAANGDFANKVGTYSVAVAAAYHKIPFYPVAPYTTVDLNCPSGREIPIEERSAAEVQGAAGSFGSVCWTAVAAAIYNPAFDVTPVDLVTALVTDQGVFSRAELQAGCLKDRLCGA